jgi:hypothetical protein
MNDKHEAEDLFMQILCAPERGPVAFVRGPRPGFLLSRETRFPFSAELRRLAYRDGLRDGRCGRPTRECDVSVGTTATAYALGWARGAFPRSFDAERAENSLHDRYDFDDSE